MISQVGRASVPKESFLSTNAHSVKLDPNPENELGGFRLASPGDPADPRKLNRCAAKSARKTGKRAPAALIVPRESGPGPRSAPECPPIHARGGA